MYKYILMLILGLAGCVLLPDKSPTRRFPEHIKNECYGALNYAEEIIKRVGAHSIKPKPVSVELVTGQKNYGRLGWGFRYYHPGFPNGYIDALGICDFNGRRVLVGANPNNRHDINIGTLRHEMAHHWLISNGYVDMHHYPVYDKYFDGWSDSRRVTGLSQDSDQDYEAIHFNIEYKGEIISVTQVIQLNETL